MIEEDIQAQIDKALEIVRSDLTKSDLMELKERAKNGTLTENDRAYAVSILHRLFGVGKQPTIRSERQPPRIFPSYADAEASGLDESVKSAVARTLKPAEQLFTALRRHIKDFLSEDDMYASFADEQCHFEEEYGSVPDDEFMQLLEVLVREELDEEKTCTDVEFENILDVHVYSDAERCLRVVGWAIQDDRIAAITNQHHVSTVSEKMQSLIGNLERELRPEELERLMAWACRHIEAIAGLLAYSFTKRVQAGKCIDSGYWEWIDLFNMRSSSRPDISRCDIRTYRCRNNSDDSLVPTWFRDSARIVFDNVKSKYSSDGGQGASLFDRLREAERFMAELAFWIDRGLSRGVGMKGQWEHIFPSDLEMLSSGQLYPALFNEEGFFEMATGYFAYPPQIACAYLDWLFLDVSVATSLSCAYLKLMETRFGFLWTVFAGRKRAFACAVACWFGVAVALPCWAIIKGINGLEWTVIYTAACLSFPISLTFLKYTLRSLAHGVFGRTFNEDAEYSAISRAYSLLGDDVIHIDTLRRALYDVQHGIINQRVFGMLDTVAQRGNLLYVNRRCSRHRPW